MNFFDLGLDPAANQFIESYLRLQLCQLKQQRAQHVYDRLKTELNKKDATELAEARLMDATRELDDAKNDFVTRGLNFKVRK